MKFKLSISFKEALVSKKDYKKSILKSFFKLQQNLWNPIIIYLLDFDFFDNYQY